MAGPGKLSWDTVEVWQKLVAAIIASGVKVNSSPSLKTKSLQLENRGTRLTSSQIDVSNVATHFGTTYDTIENRLRPIKKQAKVLQEQVSNGMQDKVTSTRKSPSKPRTPKKAAGALDGTLCFRVGAFASCLKLILSSTVVSNGRVTKTTPSGKASKKNALKQEAIENSFSSMMDDGFADLDSAHEGLGPLDFENGMALGNMFD